MQPAFDPKSPQGQVRYWLDQISEALKREKDFRKEGHRISLLYEGEKKETFQYNILYSNTETMGPALYNSVPRPVVQRRFKDEDPLGALAAKAAQRALEYFIDDGLSEYATFDDLMKAAVLEALVPGRGVTRFKYDAQVVDQDDSGAAPEVRGETVCGEEVPWDRFLHGYAKKWKDVPWAAFLHIMTKEELEDNFGQEIAARIPVAMQSDTDDGDDDSNRSQQDGKLLSVKVAHVWEIWDKTSRKVIFIATSYKDAPIKEADDPLQLTGFFPCPEPLSFVSKITSLVPVPLYHLYEEQAKELNAVTVRINKLVRALKVRGMYDTTVEGIADVLKADDNQLVPAQNVAALQAMGLGALEKAIWLFPIKDLILALQQLYQFRDQVKQVIYEITGIADIMRGSSQASETLGAQEIKTQWGTLRLKRLQKEVARYARDALRIITEIAVTKLSEDTMKGITGLPYPTGSEKAQAMALAGQVQAVGQPLPPQLAQVVSSPSWSDVLGLLQNDLQRSYRIDIETNSTVDAEATEDKQNIAELLNAISQFLNGVGPLIENGSMPFEVAQGMLLAIVRRFRFGPELEDQLKQMKPPQPKPDPKLEAAKQQAAHDQQMQQAELQQKQVESQMRQQEMAMEMEFKQREHQLRMAELTAKAQLQQLQAATQMRTAQAQADIARQNAGTKAFEAHTAAAAAETKAKQQADAAKAKPKQGNK